MAATQSVFPALAAGDLSAVRHLLEEDPGLVWVRYSAQDGDLMTPLQYAASNGQVDACRLLVEFGAEVYTNPMNTYPPVMLAAWNKQPDVVRYFLEEIPDKAEGTNGLGVAINLAARQGWIELVKEHIQRDPLSVHQRGWIGDSPLHWPSHNNYPEIVSVLLDAGADIEADEINCYGGKPLHWASEHAPDSVRVLLGRGAAPNSRNQKADSGFFGMTPLIMNATQRDDCAEVTELLIDAGADIAAVDAKGKTALEHARERGLQRITAVLLAHGAA
ncbi:MAG: ankyrin repeat domain-containing protein [Armatimonadetes bacterium]|nr:ankyrin repeat domain-containing protein [Armatimonadota bacterium]MDE2206623.1 ankyrin repeat domain-containing protein [Armatimonadota bacterium]